MSNHPVVRATALLALAAFCSCSYHRTAGSMQVRAGHPVHLQFEAPEPIDVEVEVWSKGPADVAWQAMSPSVTATGVLKPGGREARWDANTRKLAIRFSVTEDDATVQYTVRSDRGFQVSMGERQP